MECAPRAVSADFPKAPFSGSSQEPHVSRSFQFLCGVSCLVLAILPVSGGAPLRAADGDEQQLLADAQAGIEKCRKAEATIAVVDRAGRPVPGARVRVEQTRHAFLFGCNLFGLNHCGNPHDDATYARQFAELLNYATLPFYWGSFEPRQGQPHWEKLQGMAEWCQQHGITAKGHPLAWHEDVPAWLPEDPRQSRRLLAARIDDCVARFRGLVDCWDVVNEAANFAHFQAQKSFSPRYLAMWKEAGPMELVRDCFEHARKANAQATLLVNDYVLGPQYEQVIGRLLDPPGRRLCDAIGIQSHMHRGAWPGAKLLEICQRLGRFGRPLHFTETTIVSGQFQRPGPAAPWPSTPEGEAYQAREAVRFYTLLFSQPAVAAITWWDFSDRGAWQNAPAGLLRADMTPKPAYRELRKLIKETWWTTADLACDRAGRAALRGFLGDYRATVTAAGATMTVERLKIQKNASNAWTIRLR
jgi:GH35 family endo-1,4-beta-xylanase